MPRGAAAALHEIQPPDDTEADEAARAVKDLRALLQAHPAPEIRARLLLDDNGAGVVLPPAALGILVDVLAELADGNAVTVAPVHAELTTQQAANLMNVSRPYLVKLLDRGEIPCRRVGNRRKLQLVDVLAYKRRDDAHRQLVLDDLAREAEDLGLYS